MKTALKEAFEVPMEHKEMGSMKKKMMVPTVKLKKIASRYKKRKMKLVY